MQFFLYNIYNVLHSSEYPQPIFMKLDIYSYLLDAPRMQIYGVMSTWVVWKNSKFDAWNCMSFFHELELKQLNLMTWTVGETELVSLVVHLSKIVQFPFEWIHEFFYNEGLLTDNYRRDFDRPQAFAVRFSSVHFGRMRGQNHYVSPWFNMVSVDIKKIENKYDYPDNYELQQHRRSSVAGE